MYSLNKKDNPLFHSLTDPLKQNTNDLIKQNSSELISKNESTNLSTLSKQFGVNKAKNKLKYNLNNLEISKIEEQTLMRDNFVTHKTDRNQRKSIQFK